MSCQVCFDIWMYLGINCLRIMLSGGKLTFSLNGNHGLGKFMVMSLNFYTLQKRQGALFPVVGILDVAPQLFTKNRVIKMNATFRFRD